MSQIEEFKKLGNSPDERLSLHFFGWHDAQGNQGDYGLNSGPAENTFRTLITTTYMFQPEPAFCLQARPFEMTEAQFEYLQDNDIDNEAFLSQLGPMPEVAFELDLSLYKDSESALAAMTALFS